MDPLNPLTRNALKEFYFNLGKRFATPTNIRLEPQLCTLQWVALVNHALYQEAIVAAFSGFPTKSQAKYAMRSVFIDNFHLDITTGNMESFPELLDAHVSGREFQSAMKRFIEAHAYLLELRDENVSYDAESSEY